VSEVQTSDLETAALKKEVKPYPAMARLHSGVIKRG
jgi:hypothetical protein